MRIPLPDGREVLLDDDDLPILAGRKVFLDKDGYPRVGQSKLHRLVMGVTKPFPHVDHVNGNKLDCTKASLRLCSPQENSFNTGPKRGGKYKGVTKVHRRFRAQISRDGKKHTIGYFRTPEEAARAYDSKAKELFGRFAWLNFREETTHAASVGNVGPGIETTAERPVSPRPGEHPGGDEKGSV